MTTSAPARASSSRDSGRAEPPTRSATLRARSWLRLATTTVRAPARAAVVAASAPMPPAPTTSTERSPSAPSSASARASPACTSEPLTRSIEVSVCTRLATRSACWSTAFRAGPTWPSRWARAERAAHLAEDLRLADGHRVQARGHREDVRDAALLVVHEQVRLQVVAVDRAGLGQGRGDVGERAVEGEALGVDLGAVARGEHDGLGDVLGAQHGDLEGGAAPPGRG